MKLMEPIPTVQGDPKRAKELLVKAADLGDAMANMTLGIYYKNGAHPPHFPKDPQKSRTHLEKGAIGGNPIARSFLAELERHSGNLDLAYRHYMIAASAGHKDSLQNVGFGYKTGQVHKEDFARTLRAYKKSSDELTSNHRSKSARRMARGMSDASDTGHVLQMLDLLKKMEGAMKDEKMTGVPTKLGRKKT